VAEEEEENFGTTEEAAAPEEAPARETEVIGETTEEKVKEAGNEKEEAKRTGWQKINTKWYYFTSSGAMVTGTQTIDGKTYHFDSSGVWID